MDVQTLTAGTVYESRFVGHVTNLCVNNVNNYMNVYYNHKG